MLEDPISGFSFFRVLNLLKICQRLFYTMLEDSWQQLVDTWDSYWASHVFRFYMPSLSGSRSSFSEAQLLAPE